MQKFFSLILKANQDFIRHTGDDLKLNAPVLNSFYESIGEVYIPLLRMIEKLADENLKFCIGLVMPPLLCNMLADEILQEAYLHWLDERIELGQAEVKRNKSNGKIKALAAERIQSYKDLKADFVDNYSCKLIPVFSAYMEKGYLELLGTCGTDIFLPHYADMKEIVSAQIESGLQ